MDSDLTDPVELALCVFDLQKLHMHGPEYHSIVPAVLLVQEKANTYAVSLLKTKCASKQNAPIILFNNKSLIIDVIENMIRVFD